MIQKMYHGGALVIYTVLTVLELKHYTSEIVFFL